MPKLVAKKNRPIYVNSFFLLLSFYKKQKLFFYTIHGGTLKIYAFLVLEIFLYKIWLNLVSFIQDKIAWTI